jgi:hypothetical protein
MLNELDVDAVLATVKALSALISGALGAAAVFGSFVENGKLKRSGKLVLACVTASAAVGVCASVIEGYKAKTEGEQQAQRNERLLQANEALLRQIKRTLRPITRAQVIAQLTLPEEHPLVRKYLARVRPLIEQGLKDEQSIFGKRKNAFVPASFGLAAESKFWPSGDELPIIAFLETWGEELAIYARPVLSTEISTVQPDFSVSKIGDSGGGKSNQVSLSWNRAAKRIEALVVVDYVLNSGLFGNRSGRVVSLSDLPGSELVIGSGLALDEPYRSLGLSLPKPQTIAVSLADGHVFVAESKRLAKLADGAISYKLGENEGEFTSLPSEGAQ